MSFFDGGLESSCARTAASSIACAAPLTRSVSHGSVERRTEKKEEWELLPALRAVCCIDQ